MNILQQAFQCVFVCVSASLQRWRSGNNEVHCVYCILPGHVVYVVMSNPFLVLPWYIQAKQCRLCSSIEDNDTEEQSNTVPKQQCNSFDGCCPCISHPQRCGCLHLTDFPISKFNFVQIFVFRHQRRWVRTEILCFEVTSVNCMRKSAVLHMFNNFVYSHSKWKMPGKKIKK